MASEDRHSVSWPTKRIGDFASVKGGKRLPAGTSLTSKRTNHPYIRIVDFKDGRVDKTNLLFVPDDVFPRISRYTISANDLYISIVGTIGLVGAIDQGLEGANLTENAAKICDINDCVDREYLLAYLRSHLGQQQIKALTVGSTQPKLALYRIEDILVPCPPVEEQRAIAQILGVLDDKIELNRKMNETLEAMARALFKSWFVDFAPVRAKAEGRNTGLPDAIAALFPASFEEAETGSIPTGWSVCGLDEIARFLNGLALQKFPPMDGRSLPVIKIAQLRTEDTKSADQASADLANDYIVEDGDVLFSWSGSLTCILWAGGRGALNQHLFKVTSSSYPKWFYWLWILQHLAEFQSIAADKATTMGHIQRRHLSEAKVFLPPTALIEEASKHFAPIVDQIIGLKVEAKSLVATRDALLPKLISGEIRLNGNGEEA
jgi:type I restriction enzyme S subunit